jgi:hypothetical protein
MTVGSQDVHAFWLLTETNGHACKASREWELHPGGGCQVRTGR